MAQYSAFSCLPYNGYYGYLLFPPKYLCCDSMAEYVPLQVQKQFYQGYILPLLDYGSITWGSTSTANIER